MKSVLRYEWTEKTANGKPIRKLTARRSIDVGMGIKEGFVFHFKIGDLELSGDRWFFDLERNQWEMRVYECECLPPEQPEKVFNKENGWEVETENIAPVTDQVHRMVLLNSEYVGLKNFLQKKARKLGGRDFHFDHIASASVLIHRLLELAEDNVAREKRAAELIEKKRLAEDKTALEQQKREEEAAARDASKVASLGKKLLELFDYKFSPEKAKELLDLGSMAAAGRIGDCFMSDGQGGLLQLVPPASALGNPILTINPPDSPSSYVVSFPSDGSPPKIVASGADTTITDNTKG